MTYRGKHNFLFHLTALLDDLIYFSVASLHLNYWTTGSFAEAILLMAHIPKVTNLINCSIIMPFDILK